MPPKLAKRQVWIAAIGTLANQTGMLADSRSQIRYQDFEPMPAKLHKDGFFPDRKLLSAFAFAAPGAPR